MTEPTAETANRTESSPQLTEMGRLTLRGTLMGVRRKTSNGTTTAGIRNQNWSFKIGYKSILLVPSWTSQELPSWDLRNRKKIIRFSNGRTRNLKSIEKFMLVSIRLGRDDWVWLLWIRFGNGRVKHRLPFCFVSLLSAFVFSLSLLLTYAWHLAFLFLKCGESGGIL